MRHIEQLALTAPWIGHEHATELAMISELLDAQPRLAVLEMVKSSWVYRKLRDFRAGIESGISLLKRVFGLARCIWKGALGFHAYVRTAVLAANLLTLARHRLA